VSLTAAHTFWTVLAAAGLLLVFWPRPRSAETRIEVRDPPAEPGPAAQRLTPLRLPLLGAAIACGGALTVAYFTQRYLHDALPLLTLAAAAAWQTFLAGRPDGRWRRTLTLLLVLLGLFTCLTSVAVTMAQPRWS
jgi:hypothetical protein